jgi:hypothetical protein
VCDTYAIARVLLLMMYMLLLPLAVQGKVVLSDELIPLSAKGLDDLRKQLTKTVAQVVVQNLNKKTDTLDDALECREVKELRSVYVCMSFFQQDLNDAFTRMGIFMGAAKDTKAGTLLNINEPLLVNYKKLVAGHNLPGKVIEAFYQAISSSSSELDPFELMFLQGFVQHPSIQKLKDNFYVIGVSVQR